MTSTTRPRRRIALIAHDNKKQDMPQWADYNRGLLTSLSRYSAPALTRRTACHPSYYLPRRGSTTGPSRHGIASQGNRTNRARP